MSADRTLQLIPIDQIRVIDRLRPVDPDWVAVLAGSIQRDGLLHPIEVCREGKGFRLVIGGHRLAAKKSLGHTEIDAIVRDHESLGRRSREIAENLFRHDLNPIDRAAFVTELYQLELQRAGVDMGAHRAKLGGLARGRQAQVEAGLASAMLAGAYQMQQSLAEKTRFSTRTIQREIALHRGLKPAVAERLRGHPIAAVQGQLLAIAKLSEADQVKAADAIVAGDAKTAADAALLIHGGRKERPDEKRLKTAIAAFQKLNPKQRGAFLAVIAKDALPRGFSITVPEGRA